MSRCFKTVRTKSDCGFALAEVLLALTLFTVLGVMAMQAQTHAVKLAQIRIDAAEIETAMDLFGHYATQQELDAEQVVVGSDFSQSLQLRGIPVPNMLSRLQSVSVLEEGFLFHWYLQDYAHTAALVRRLATSQQQGSNVLTFAVRP
ncbi:hypothetical protein [Aliidiomarina haloalkalitolerans]|uniref:Uncharacterized protein n=1 Tax=Aliidiomarina haloalkalitolerans TaxID=859059 RepID=A0A432VQT5_9GAMM|nr:hypothetical protein [Aliidiomarina haloalkalitolerans]RUO18617.1 hypothetical protein CWE06_10260 [Aliidiomarina haloalkalitolerans]